MKGLRLSALVLALLAALAWTRSQPPKAVFASERLSEARTRAQERDQSAKTFTGKIIKSDDRLVLQVDAISAPYQLDDQQKAAKFEGKKVKVTGTLDMANNVIHVQSIASAA